MILFLFLTKTTLDCGYEWVLPESGSELREKPDPDPTLEKQPGYGSVSGSYIILINKMHP